MSDYTRDELLEMIAQHLSLDAERQRDGRRRFRWRALWVLIAVLAAGALLAAAWRAM